MDILRALLLVGLVTLLWQIRIQGVRPVRDFFVWGMHYPFHFILTAVLILVIWGAAGADFGLQGLFLDEDPLTQILLGATVTMILAAIIVHYSVLDTSMRAWRASLQDLTRMLLATNNITKPAVSVQGILRNGFLERLQNSDIDAIDAAMGLQPKNPSEKSQFDDELLTMLEGEPFRLLVSPAVLLVKGFMLLFLVGVVPTLLVPLINRDPLGCFDRLPWLIGVVLGHVLGIVLACWTTQWAAKAAGWNATGDRILEHLRLWAKDGRTARPEDESDHAASTHAPSWVSFLCAFYVIHAIGNTLIPDSITSRWIDWPERNAIVVPSESAEPDRLSPLWQSFPWLPLAVLLAESAVAAFTLLTISVVPRLVPQQWLQTARAVWQRLVHAVMGMVFSTITAGRISRMVFACLILVVLALLSILTLGSAAWLPWSGLRGYASLGAVLVVWLGGFRLATLETLRDADLSPLRKTTLLVALISIVFMDQFQVPDILVAPLAILATAVSVGAMVPALPSLSNRRVVVACSIVAIGILSVYGAWLGSFTTAVTKVWLGLATLLLGAMALASVARSRPALLFPLTILLGFFAFAIPYNALDERWQSAMPAAGSIACALALVAAIYTMIMSARPRSALLTAVALGSAAMLLNGTALFVAPNQFKGTFPNMESYYAKPIYLDSRDYFRDTTPSTVRLRNRQVTDDFDRLAKQGTSERLATAYFKMRPITHRADGSYSVSLAVEDSRGRLRATEGDEVLLSAEEWFTIQLDGEDCIALAEEPFFRKIFPWFRYESLHMIRDGIIRGPLYPLAKASAVSTAHPANGPAPTAYTAITSGHVLGLRLMGLAPSYRKADAQYVLIAINWTGRVTEVRHESHLDNYTVEFDIPMGSEPLNEQQLAIMAAWMERCHLDTVRSSRVALPKAEAIPALPVYREGDCVVLDDARAEAPVPVGVFLAGDPAKARHYPDFTRYWPTRTNLERTIASTPAPSMAVNGAKSGDNGNRFTLRLAHDRGLFASDVGMPDLPDTGVARVALYNAGRLRPGDRLILSWNGSHQEPKGPAARCGAVYEVMRVEPRVSEPADRLPPGSQWVNLRPVVDANTNNSAIHPQPDVKNQPFLIGEWQLIQPLNNTEVLLAWKRLVANRWKGRKPKLVIVTVSGGGIRASVWTSVVLRKLETTLGADFPYHIRLITGASGGMVGGSYYVTSLAPPSDAVLGGGTANFSALHGASIDAFVEQMATDQLDAVAGRMLFADLPGALNPFRKKGDRGRTLEQTWIRWTGGRDASPLARSLQSYAADEQLGRRPSMVYTPMMVEDGRRLLISNLDMAFATRNVGGLLIEPSSRKIDRPTIQGGDFDTSIHDEDDVFSLSAVEFFRLFPKAHDFRVTTAVRMSASFPWVSPAINLPTLPPRRVVDAAYYDNYGVNLTALWISKMSSWLKENTSGVVVIQIRDNVSQGARTEIDFDRSGTESAIDRLTWNAGGKLLSPGIQAVTTPLSGVSNARQWTMAFRNDEQVDLLDLLFDDERGRDFFRTVVFECPIEVSLNWKLTAREKEVLTSGFGRADALPRDELGRVRDFLIGKDSYEFHKWRIEHRNDDDFQIQLKQRYVEQLQNLGFTATDRLTLRQSQDLYENVVKNLKRLELLSDWWREGREEDPDRTNRQTTK